MAAVVIPSSEPSISASAANFEYDEGAVFFPSNSYGLDAET